MLAFYLWTALFSSLVFVQFWFTADDAFGLDDAKEAFGLIGAGGLIGAVAGSAGARPSITSGRSNPPIRSSFRSDPPTC